MRYQLDNGQVILADQAFIERHHPDAVLLSEPVPDAAVVRKAEILARLAEIDVIADKPRTRRELALGKAATKTWLQTLDAEAADLRTELGAL